MIPDIEFVLRAAGTLAALLLLLWLAGRLLRRRGLRAGAARRLVLEEALPLDARRRLLLVRCDGRPLLLLTGGGQDTVIGWLPEAPA